jgi:hypothetical protein
VDGYRTALQLLPKIAWLGLDTPLDREQWLHMIESEDLGCPAGTCAIQLGQFEEAVELLDLGRSVFWQQASSLRSDLGKLREDAPELAKEVDQIGRQLDAGNYSDLALNSIGKYNLNNSQQSPEDIRRECYHLLGKWEGLLDRVRELPGLEHFLRPMPFHLLRQACTVGQVIIINASKYGVDALIFGTAGRIEHVPLPNIDLETLTRLSQDIVLQRPTHASVTQRQTYNTRFLKPALRIVWKDILIPIFDKVQITLVDTSAMPQRRIWWYLTGPLTFIPIHAAGPGSGVIDVNQLVISSYMTTLESLFQAQKRKPVSTSQQILLSISQAETPGQCPLPKTVEEADGVVHEFCSSGLSEGDVTCLHGSDATVDRVLAALSTCSWAHFACHAFQHSSGMNSAFALQDGHLRLGDIAFRQLPNAQFAFLSACQAATGQNNLPGEAMHLAAAIQFAGFRSVIATMWSISDKDALRLADHIYKYLLRNDIDGLDPSDAATALNRAVLHLREDPNVTVDRWAPFIHFGI